MPTIKVNGINLYYEIHGKGQPVVFIAGFTTDHNAWMGIAKDFAKKYQVIVLDNRGVGRTDAPNFLYTSKMMTEDTIELIQKLQVGPAHFIGSSFGGSIVQEIAYRYPKLIKSGVIVNSFPIASQRLKFQVETRLQFMLAKVPEKAIAESGCAWLFSNNYLSKTKEIAKLVKGDLANPYPVSIVGYKGQMNAMLKFDSRKWMHKIKAPCLIITGDDDVLADVTQSEQLAAAIKNSEYYCFEGGGHVPVIEQPKAFTKLVLGFIAKHS